MAVADTLSRHARSADQLARLDVGRFGILLPETGEVEAVNYVERVRAACDLWLESGAIALKLAIGWAAPPVDGTLGDAIAVAEERVLAERERNKARVTQAPAPATQATTGSRRLALARLRLSRGRAGVHGPGSRPCGRRRRPRACPRR